MTELHLGTCSWKYPSWAGILYSAEKDIDYLFEYSQKLNAVEVDRWFWSLFERGAPRLPNPLDVLAYRRSVPDGFRFVVKAPNSITLTHQYRASKDAPLVGNPHFLCVDLFREFVDRIEAIRDALGPILLQFEYLNRQKMPSEEVFRERLAAFVRQLPTGLQYGVETRNPKYLSEDFLSFLRDLAVIPALISGYWMPPLPRVLMEHRQILSTFPAVVVRLMGADRRAIEQKTGQRWNKIVDPHDEELDAVSREVTQLRATGVHPFLLVNNHYEGSAPLTIERLCERLELRA